MGSGRRKPIQKSKSQRKNHQSLFIEGGILGGFDPPLSSTSRKGKNQMMKSGNSANGLTSNSKNSSRKSSANSFGYKYPSFDFKDAEQLGPCNGGNIEDSSSRGLQPVILLGSRDSKIVAFEDPGPSKSPSKVEYHYEYSSDFVLGESSHSALGFSDEPEKNPGVTELSSGLVDEEGEQLHRGLGFSDQPESVASGVLLSSTSVQGKKELIDGSSSHEVEEEEEDDYDVVDDDDDDDDDDVDDDRGSMDEDEFEDGSGSLQEFLVTTPSRVKNSAFVSIGGVRLYTQDISDEEDDEEDDEDDTSDEGSSSDSGDSDSLDLDSDIDDDIMEDYLDGIGGTSQILKSKWLASQDFDGHAKGDDDDFSSDEYMQTVKKLSGVALQEASREYGKQKEKSKKNASAKFRKPKAAEAAWSSAKDDLMLIKDPRQRPAKKKHVAQFPQSWPSEGRKSKKYGRFPGEKKRHRKEMIVVKRRERMLRRGTDLEQINLKLKHMVLNNIDMQSFPPMHTRDCSQVQRLAAIYRLKSGCLGSGKKRFVTVSQTQHTSMPSASDEIRLEKLIGSNKDDADFPVIDTPKSAYSGSARKKSTNNSANLQSSGSRSGKRSEPKAGAYNQPVSFVPSGVIQSEVVQASNAEPEENKQEGKEMGISSSIIGSFEVHTKGLGSKMMAKMGYVEGEGLGKDGKGMSQPIEVIQRPKSLGLGMAIVESSSDAVNMGKSSGGSVRKQTPESARTSTPASARTSTPASARTSTPASARKSTPASARNSTPASARNSTSNIGSFEKHTKGFGSKMMARMGFVEGMGLGRDSQGIVTPLSAVRRPKARGLGAEGKRS